MFGDRLRLARKKAGLSLRELAAIMDPTVSAQAISRYESNGMMPSSRVLVGLRKALGVSLDLLMSDEVAELTRVEFRTSARDRARAEAVVTEALESYLAIEDILGILPIAAVMPERGSSYDEAESLADKLRGEWGIGAGPIPSLTGLLEERGIKVIEENVPGMACVAKRGGNRPDAEAVAVSRNINVERKRFALAREIAHRVFERPARPDVKYEAAMNRFAGAFLVCGDHLRQKVGPRRRGIAYHEVMELKKFYGVPASALLVRLRDTGILPESVIVHAFRPYAKNWRTVEPEPIGFGAFERPKRFEGLVYRALAEQLISPARAAQLLKRPLAEIERGIRGPRFATTEPAERARA